MSLPSVDPLVRLPGSGRTTRARINLGCRAEDGRGAACVEQPIGVAVRIAADAVAGVRKEHTTRRTAGARTPRSRRRARGQRSCRRSRARVAQPEWPPSGCLDHLPNPDDSLLVAGLVP
jgi:hypothetical protein